MNFGVLSNDEMIYKDIQKRIHNIIGDCFYYLYPSFLHYKISHKYVEIDCLIIDMDLDDWIQQTKDLNTDLSIIFIGSHLQDSYKVYDFNHISYVYKEKMEYFDLALKKANELYIKKLGKIHYNIKNTVYIESLANILYFESDKRKTIIHRKDGSCVSTYKNIEEFILEISNSFVRINKKYFVNRSVFKKIDKNKIELINGSTLTISRPYISMMNEYKIEEVSMNV